MANSITTDGMTGGTTTTTHKSGESVRDWVDRHNKTVSDGTPNGDTLTTKWPCGGGVEEVVTNRLPGESDADFTLRHEGTYMLEMLNCPPEP